jgi:sterol desaturase/sphingolipid hydroxylase (fatty acid hydroxylase superfamily)
MNNLIKSSIIIVSVFSLSAITSYIICKILNKPFINPEYKSEQIINQLIDMLYSLPILLFESILFNTYIYHKLLPNNYHNLTESIFTCILYSVFTEFNYYIYHYIAHSKYIYPYIHKKHHKKINVYPFDTFYFTIFDEVLLSLCLAIPLLFIKVTFAEQIILLYIYITSSFISHSNYLYDTHYLHHNLLNCNYCILFPYFDILFGTFRTKLKLN